MEYYNRFLKEKLYLDSVIYSYPAFFRFIEMILYSFVCLLMPVFLSHPQLLLGSVVNAILILSACYLKNYEVLPAILLPSAGVVLAGVLFGGLTTFVMFMVPFIWIGNGILVYLFKKYYVSHKKNYLNVLVAGAIVKSIFLGIAVLVMFFSGLVPAALLVPFSMLQIVTALIGGAGAFAVVRTRAYFGGQ